MDTIADPPGVPFIKKLEFINSIVLDNYTFSIDGEIVGDPVDIRVKKRLSIPESDLSYGAFTVSVNGEVLGDPVGIPFIRKLTLGNPVGGIHTVSVEGEGVFGDNIILPVIKNISLQDYQALGGGILGF